jgi:TPR repeat protein
MAIIGGLWLFHSHLSAAPESKAVARVNELQKKANAGDPRAQFLYGRMIGAGNGVPVNIPEAIKWIQKSANSGYSKAQYNMGLAFKNGTGVPENPSESAKWFELAAIQGLGLAEYRLGNCYAEGIGVKRNIQTAIEWWQKAVSHNITEAYNSLAALYYYGKDDIKADIDMAIKFFEQGVNKNNVLSMQNLATHYFQNKDYKMAGQLHLSSAYYGNAVSQLTMVFFYMGGIGTEKNYVDGYAWAQIVYENPDSTKEMKDDAQEEIKKAWLRMPEDNHNYAKKRVEILKSEINQRLKFQHDSWADEENEDLLYYTPGTKEFTMQLSKHELENQFISTASKVVAMKTKYDQWTARIKQEAATGNNKKNIDEFQAWLQETYSPKLTEFGYIVDAYSKKANIEEFKNMVIKTNTQFLVNLT